MLDSISAKQSNVTSHMSCVVFMIRYLINLFFRLRIEWKQQYAACRCFSVSERLVRALQRGSETKEVGQDVDHEHADE